MRAAMWVTTTVLMVTAIVLALSAYTQQDASSPEEVFPAAIEAEREPARTLVAPEPSSSRAAPRGATAELPVAIAAKTRASTGADGLPAESMLQVDDALDFQCAMQVMSDERFADAIQALSDDARSVPAALEMRSAIAEAYREAFALAGGGAEVASLACGLRLCMIETRLPADTAEDEIRTAFVNRLLGDVDGPAVSLAMPAEESKPRVVRRVFAVSPALTRTDPRVTSCKG
jgi:hypothetical protein